MVRLKPVSRPPLALIGSGQEWSARSLESVLAPRGYGVIKAFTVRQLVTRVREDSPDLVIIQDDLSEGALAACSDVRAALSAHPSTPILITAAEPWASKNRIAALRAGAWEVLPRPFNAEELILRLNTYAQAKLETNRVREAGLVDVDTGFLNIWGLMKRVAEHASAASRFGRALACIVLEPDRVQRTSEATRDEMLVITRIADAIQSSARLHDTLGRVSPLTFVVIAPETDRAGSRRLAERLVEAAQRALPEEQLNLRAGIYASRNFREAGVEAVEVVASATAALRNAQVSRERIREHAAPEEPEAAL